MSPEPPRSEAEVVRDPGGDTPGETAFPVRSSTWRLDGIQSLLFRTARWIFFTPMVLAPPLLFLGKAGGSSALLDVGGMAFLAAMYTAPLLALLGLILEVEWPGRKDRVRIKGRKLVLERRRKETRIPLTNLRAGWVSDTNLELETRQGNVLRLALDSSGEASQLLQAAGLDARRRTVKMQLGPSDFLTALVYLLGPAFAFYGAFFVGKVIGSLGEWGRASNGVGALYAGVLLFLALRGAVQAFLAPARLTIGADGVKIEQNLKTTFVPFSSIVDWTIAEDGVSFALRSGQVIKARGRHLRFDGKASAVFARLQEARRVHLEGRGSEEARARIARGSRSISDWRGALRELLRQDGYRASSLSEEDLLRLLDSPHETAEARLGAALALREQAPGEIKKRLRVAADTCANPRLRVAFEALASSREDDATLLAAMEQESFSPGARAPRE